MGVNVLCLQYGEGGLHSALVAMEGRLLFRQYFGGKSALSSRMEGRALCLKYQGSETKAEKPDIWLLAMM